jgi:hypothetical protein
MRQNHPAQEWLTRSPESTARPTVLFIFFSFTNQTRRVASAMADVFTSLGWNVDEAAIVMADERYSLPFPLRPFWRRLFGWIPPQMLERPCDISVPQHITAASASYDLICIGSPTWWLMPALPISSFLHGESARRLLEGRPFAVFAVARSLWRLNAWRVAALARRCGGRHVASRGFVFPGNQLQSFASLACYLRTGASPSRWWGLPLYPYGLAADGLVAARRFATELASHHDTR